MKYRILFALLLACACAPAAAKTLRLALVAGHNRGLDADPRLQYAETDAQKMGDLLVEAGGVAPGNLIVLKSPRPEDLDRAFDEMRAQGAAADASDEVVFLFYYSGHGTGMHLKLGGREYPLQGLKERIDGIPAKLRIGILDACQSGAITRLKGARLVEPFIVENKLKTEGSILIASSAPDENAQESDQLRGSFFTHNLMSALRGAGDVSGDRRVTLMEAYQYAFHKTLVETEDTRGGAQHPMAAINLDVQGDVVLTDLNSGRGGLVFKPDLEGDLLVADAKSSVMAEFHKEKGRDAFLALPPGAYRVFCRDGRKTLQCKTGLKEKEIKEVGRGDLSAGFRLLGLAKGSPDRAMPDLPWRNADYPAQFPACLGLGWKDGYEHFSMTALLGFRFWPKLGAYASFTNNKAPSRSFTSPRNDREAEVGLETGAFLSQNLEFTGTFFHRAHKDEARTTFLTFGCRDTLGSDCLASETEVNPEWDLATLTGLTVGARLWIWNRVSLSVSYGAAWSWLSMSVRPVHLSIIPAVHF